MAVHAHMILFPVRFDDGHSAILPFNYDPDWSRSRPKHDVGRKASVTRLMDWGMDREAAEARIAERSIERAKDRD